MDAYLHLKDYNKGMPKDLFIRIVKIFLNEKDEFEIRHWREDLKILQKYYKFGNFSPEDGSDTEVSLKGTVDKTFIKRILSYMPHKKDALWTDVFTLNLPRFSSSHNGTEIYFDDISQEEFFNIKLIAGKNGFISKREEIVKVEEEPVEPIPIEEKVNPLDKIDVEDIAAAIKTVLHTDNMEKK